jgi:hypothetical protein
MSDEIIAKAIAQIAEHENAAAYHGNEAARLKSFVNQYDQFAGREPRFGDVTVALPIAAVTPKPTTTTRGWSAGDFLGKPFATAVKLIMQARYELAGRPAPATVDGIRETLLQGTYDFGTNNPDQQKHGIRIALGKNTQTFVRLPNSDLFGLAEWYPGVKKSIPRKALKLNGEQPASAGESSEVAGTTEAAELADGGQPPAAQRRTLLPIARVREVRPKDQQDASKEEA